MKFPRNSAEVDGIPGSFLNICKFQMMQGRGCCKKSAVLLSFGGLGPPGSVSEASYIQGTSSIAAVKKAGGL